MAFDRRTMIKAAALATASAGLAAPAGFALAKALPPFVPGAGVRSRVLFVNDLSGDIDGLFATVHAILSPSIELRGIIGTRTGRADETAAASAGLAREMLKVMGREESIPVHVGAEAKIASAGKPVLSAGTQAIIAEAMRSDTDLPLYVAAGGGLTEVASALMIEPAIAARFTLVWIGGDAYPAGGTGETNFNIDALAARHVFNETSVAIWQVPRAAYATCLVSASEVQAFVAPHGKIGQWLYDKIVHAPAKYRNYINMGETWTLGDNPLVLLTALADWVPNGARPFRYVA